MRLQQRILLAYAYLVALVVLGAVSAALGFRDLSASIGQVMGENFASVRASTEMIDGLERTNSSALAMLGGDDDAAEELAAAEVTFLDALDRARDNVTIDAEQPLLDRIAADFTDYRAARDAILERRSDFTVREYEIATRAAFDSMRAAVLELVDLNHEAMIEADRAAQRSAATRAALHGLLVALAVLSIAPIARIIREDLLDRIDELASVATAIAHGDRARRVSTPRSDELGVVGRQLNAVLDQLQRVESEAAGDLRRERELLEALLEHVPGRAALAAGDGRLLASTFEEGALIEFVDVVIERIASEPAEPADVEAGGRTLRLVPLESARGRVVGWLVRPGAAAPDEGEPAKDPGPEPA